MEKACPQPNLAPDDDSGGAAGEVLPKFDEIKTARILKNELVDEDVGVEPIQNSVVSISPDKQHSIAAVKDRWNRAVKLLAVVQAGDSEMFGVVKAGLDDRKVVVTEFGGYDRDKQMIRAKVVGVAEPENAVMIGRGNDFSPELNLSKNVSSKHLAVDMKANGTINIFDLGSTNGTIVFTTDQDRYRGILSQEYRLWFPGTEQITEALDKASVR